MATKKTDERTSKSVATEAGKQLGQSKRKVTKSLAATVLSQSKKEKATSSKQSSLAGKVLSIDESTKAAKKLAGSALTQASNSRKNAPSKNVISSGTNSGGPRKK